MGALTLTISGFDRSFGMSLDSVLTSMSNSSLQFIESNLKLLRSNSVFGDFDAIFCELRHALGLNQKRVFMSFEKLTWGVKASFRGYVEAAGGSIAVSDGAESTADGAIVFKAVPGGDLAFAPDGSATGSMRFEGTVTFNAHGGMLNSTLAELGLEVSEDGKLHLTVLEAPMNQGRCAIATVGPIEIGADESVTAATQITMDGMYQIADNYPPGTELDQLKLD